MTGSFRLRPAAQERLVEAIAYGVLNFGHAVETGGKANAPVRGGHRSFTPDAPVGGTLRLSIHTVLYIDGKRIGPAGDENGNALPDYVPRMGIVVFVGTNSGYGFWVHDGTRVMAARPFLVESLMAHRADASALVRAGAKRKLGQ